jgi:hypothetical protein
VVHLIRAANRFASYTDRKTLSAGLKPIYTAANADAAQLALLEFAESDLGRKYPAAVAVFERAWDRFIPFLEFPPEARKIIYTTDEVVKGSGDSFVHCRDSRADAIGVPPAAGVKAGRRPPRQRRRP